MKRSGLLGRQNTGSTHSLENKQKILSVLSLYTCTTELCIRITFDADPDADPDSTHHPDADADPGSESEFSPYTDPDPSFQIKAKIGLYFIHFGLSSAKFMRNRIRFRIQLITLMRIRM